MSKRHILVVDDEPEIRGLVQEILEDEGFTVDAAENASKARELIATHTPNLILLDIWMPDVDGITLLKEWNINLHLYRKEGDQLTKVSYIKKQRLF